MADLNIRNVGEEFMRALKVQAVERGLTLRELCLEKLGAIQIVKLEKTKPAKSRPQIAGESLNFPAARCQTCFGLLPYHQKGCAKK